MTYNINAQIVYDYQELKKYGLSIQNVSINWKGHINNYFNITGDVIVIDSKADKYFSFELFFTFYGKGKNLGSDKCTVIPTAKKDNFFMFFTIPYDEVDKIRITVKNPTLLSSVRKRNSDNFGRKRHMYDPFDEFQAEMDRRDILQTQMDMMDMYDFYD